MATESVAPYGRASVHRFAAWPQPIGANIMVSITGEVKVNGSFVPEGVATALHTQPPTQDQLQHAMVAIGQLKHVFQQRSEIS